jgi:hypothetical protein
MGVAGYIDRAAVFMTQKEQLNTYTFDQDEVQLFHRFKISFPFNETSLKKNSMMTHGASKNVVVNGIMMACGAGVLHMTCMTPFSRSFPGVLTDDSGPLYKRIAASF